MATMMLDQVGTESLKDRLKDALAQARQVCELGPEAATDCKLAWETVAELGIASSAQAEAQPFYASYCDANPGAIECKVYDV
ncbi:MAG: hypothetical protein HC824_00575 [Synechococcales cyanobacterium RM1_1_8]|nr:hypothetical protein [Synechococcales cyanobacterium RM1_1_8]